MNLAEQGSNANGATASAVTGPAAPQTADTTVGATPVPDSPLAPPADAGSVPPGPATRVTGIVLIRGQFAKAGTSLKYENPDLIELLSTPIPGIEHPLLDFRDADVSTLDIDNHDSTVTREAVEATMRDVPGWNIGHLTHRDGAHLYFVGEKHRERAVMAAVSVPKGLLVEVKSEARHPLGIHPDAPQAVSGPLITGPTHDGGGSGATDASARDKWLAEHGMVLGGRYPHTHCPIDPSPASGSDPVVVADDHIICHRCRARGVSLGGSPPGVFQFEKNGVAQQLRRWAHGLVHWTQLVHTVRALYPHIPIAVVREAYEILLHEEHGDADARIHLVFMAGRDTLLTASGDWVLCGARELQHVERPSAKLLARLPALRYPTTGKKGKPESVSDDEKLAKACMGWIPGYPRVQFLRPPIPLSSHGGDPGVALATDPAYGDVRLLDDPIPWDICCAELETAFPGMQPAAIVALVAAVFCIQNRRGQPPIIFMTGPSGSGKGASTAAAAAFLGEYPQQLDFSMTDEKLSRSLGLGCSVGQRVFQSDELGKDPKLAERIPAILRLSSRTTMRNLYEGRNLIVATPLILVVTCTNLPFMLTDLDEMVRRTRVIRLPRAVPDWSATCGGDVRDWPRYASRNRLIANSMLTHAWRCAEAKGFNWSAAADSLGLGWLRDADAASARRAALVALYEACRAGTVFSVCPRFPAAGGWLDIGPLAPHVAACAGVVPDVESPDWIDQAAQELSAIDWNSQLGLAEPAVQCQVRRVGRQGVIRFLEAGKLRGDERRNGQLPAAWQVAAQ